MWSYPIVRVEMKRTPTRRNSLTMSAETIVVTMLTQGKPLARPMLPMRGGLGAGLEPESRALAEVPEVARFLGPEAEGEDFRFVAHDMARDDSDPLGPVAYASGAASSEESRAISPFPRPHADR